MLASVSTLFGTHSSPRFLPDHLSPLFRKLGLLLDISADRRVFSAHRNRGNDEFEAVGEFSSDFKDDELDPLDIELPASRWQTSGSMTRASGDLGPANASNNTPSDFGHDLQFPSFSAAMTPAEPRAASPWSVLSVPPEASSSQPSSSPLPSHQLQPEHLAAAANRTGSGAISPPVWGLQQAWAPTGGAAVFGQASGGHGITLRH